MTCNKIGYQQITVLCFIIFLFTAPSILSQSENILYKCQHDDFAVRVSDTSYANWLFKDHLRFIHNQEINSSSLKNEYATDYQKSINPQLKKLICPEGDLELYSTDLEELKFMGGTHFMLTHKINYNDEELYKMIK